MSEAERDRHVGASLWFAPVATDVAKSRDSLWLTGDEVAKVAPRHTLALPTFSTGPLRNLGKLVRQQVAAAGGSIADEARSRVFLRLAETAQAWALVRSWRRRTLPLPAESALSARIRERDEQAAIAASFAESDWERRIGLR